jgi:hypothetical protein
MLRASSTVTTVSAPTCSCRASPLAYHAHTGKTSRILLFYEHCQDSCNHRGRFCQISHKSRTTLPSHDLRHIRKEHLSCPIPVLRDSARRKDMLLWHRFCEMNTYQSSIAGSLTHTLRYWLTMGVQFNLIQLDQFGRLLGNKNDSLKRGHDEKIDEPRQDFNCLGLW